MKTQVDPGRSEATDRDPPSKHVFSLRQGQDMFHTSCEAVRGQQMLSRFLTGTTRIARLFLSFNRGCGGFFLSFRTHVLLLAFSRQKSFFMQTHLICKDVTSFWNRCNATFAFSCRHICFSVICANHGTDVTQLSDAGYA